MQASVLIEKEVVEYCNEKSVIVESKAAELLSSQKDFKKIVDGLLEENIFIFSESIVRKKLLEKSFGIEQIQRVIVKDKSFSPLALETEPRYRVISGLESEKNLRTGKIEDFLGMFREKFEFLSSVLKKRTNLEIKPISRVSRTTKNTEITVCGMVSKKWVSKNGHAVVELEDLEGKCIALFLQSDKAMFETSRKIIPDDVVAVKGKKLGDEMIVASEVHWPDLPLKQPRLGERDLNIVAISDIHAGSKLFLEKEFTKFINWINGNNPDEKEREEAGKAKYLVISGDNVDGIGVYPDQYDELAIRDIFEQYEVFCDFLKQIPEHIEVFIIPGQHDAVRRADPQPPIGKDFVKSVKDYKNIHFLGSPSWVEIEGLKTMMYHGASIHDIVSLVPGLDYTKPQELMSLLLKRRDLMCSYGLKQPYVFENENSLLVRDEPDIYFGGDIHHNGYMQYRACTIINSGTWQSKTEFQAQQGFTPTPGIAVQLNLATRKISEKRFA